jgi:PPM family protein phosphatase
VYSQNQDSFSVRPDLGLFVVADGLSTPRGGGGLASFLAVQVVERDFERSRRRRRRSRPTFRTERARLLRSFLHANRRVLEIARRYPQHAGMSTTLAALAVAGDRVVLAHVGDSRIYRVRGGLLERMTMDHSVEEDAAWRAENPGAPELSDPTKLRLLTEVIGRGWPPRIAIRIERIEPRDTFLLCTDGLHAMVWDEILRAPLSQAHRLRQAMGPECKLALPLMQCTWFVKRVRQRGAPDNLTAVVVRFTRRHLRLRTERGHGYVVHARPLDIQWVDERPAEDEDE